MTNNKRITIKDLAKTLDLSTSTISRALQNHPSISKNTIKKVQKLAAQLDYFPNSMGSNLRRNKTNLIGIIVPRINVTFHSKVVSGIEEIANKSGYNLIICQSNDDFKREVANTTTLLSNMIEGVIACLAKNTKEYNHFIRFRDHQIPLVFYDRVCYDIEASKVIIDDFESAFKATEHLVSIGCKRIAHIAGNQSTNIYISRLEGYKAALKKNGLTISPELICFAEDLTYEDGLECAEKFASLSNLPDGIFCANDYTAISAIQFFKKMKINIPKDIAIVGFSNYPSSKIIEPSLTTIDDHSLEMGRTAARLLIRQINEKNMNISSETVVLKTDLIIRESTMRNNHRKSGQKSDKTEQ
jgi:LacI family transcriptional regulator